MFAVLLRFTLSFVYKVYIGCLSRIRDWTVAVVQYSKFACESTVYLKIRLYKNLDMFTYLAMIFNYPMHSEYVFSRELTNQLSRFKKSTRTNTRSFADLNLKSRKCIVKKMIRLYMKR